MKLVVVVDTQYDFMMPDGALYVPGAEKLIAPMIQYTLSQDLQTYFMFTMDSHIQPNYDNSEEAKEFPPHCMVHSKGWQNVLPKTRSMQEMWIKEHFDMWIDPDPEAYQKVMGFKNPTDLVEIIGVAADYCVKYTYEGFKSRGFNVRVIPELTVGIKENPYA